MFVLKKIVLALVLVVLMCVSSMAKPIEVTLLFDESYPPYCYVDEDGNQVGIYIDLLKTIDEMLDDYVFIFEPIPWRRGLHLIEKGEAFAIFPPYFRPEERPWIDYSVFLMEEGFVAVIDSNRSKPPTEAWPNMFKDKVIGINRGFSVPLLEESKHLNLFKIEEADGNIVNLRKLREGRIDVYINDSLAINASILEMKRRGEEIPNVQTALYISKEMAFLGISKVFEAEYKEDFIQHVSKVLFEMHSNNEIENTVINFLNSFN